MADQVDMPDPWDPTDPYAAIKNIFMYTPFEPVAVELKDETPRPTKDLETSNKSARKDAQKKKDLLFLYRLFHDPSLCDLYGFMRQSGGLIYSVVQAKLEEEGKQEQLHDVLELGLLARLHVCHTQWRQLGSLRGRFKNVVNQEDPIKEARNGLLLILGITRNWSTVEMQEVWNEISSDLHGVNIIAIQDDEQVEAIPTAVLDPRLSVLRDPLSATDEDVADEGTIALLAALSLAPRDDGKNKKVVSGYSPPQAGLPAVVVVTNNDPSSDLGVKSEEVDNTFFRVAEATTSEDATSSAGPSSKMSPEELSRFKTILFNNELPDGFVLNVPGQQYSHGEGLAGGRDDHAGSYPAAVVVQPWKFDQVSEPASGSIDTIEND